jgi:Condensation domain
MHPLEVVSTYPASPAQEALWMLDQLIPRSPAYNCPFAFRLRGPLNRRALSGALDELVVRHEALRTRFEDDDGVPRQIVGPPQPIAVRVHDLRDATAERREREARKTVREEAETPFALAEAPLARATLIQLGANDHLLVFNVHHIVFDGWSQAVFLAELSSLYRSLLLREPSALPPLRLQYGDLVVAQRRRLEGSLGVHLAYWRRQLRDLRPFAVSPDFPRPAFMTYHGRERTFFLDADVTRRLRRLSELHRFTPFMTLLATFDALLAAYSDQRDVCVGTAVANRSTVEAERVIGLFINSVPLRVDVSDDPSFRDVLARVREVTLAALRHQDVPFHWIVNALNLPRQPARHPLFPAMLIVHNVPSPRLHLAGLEATWHRIPATTAKMDLMLEFAPAPDGLHARLRYNVDLFRDATAERLCIDFVALLSRALAEPARLISELTRAVLRG